MLKVILVALLLTQVISQVSAEEMPLLVGGHAHGSDNIQILADLDVGNFVWIPKLKYGMGNVPWDLDPEGTHGIYADVDAAVANNLFFTVSQRRGLGEIWRPGGGEYGGDCWGGDLHPAEVIQEIKNRSGNLFVGLHAEELDADFVQSGLRASSRSRIPHIYDFTDRAGGRATFEGELARIGDRYHGYGPGIKYWPNLCVTFHHSGFRVGADLVFAELLESLPATELQLAYLRGGGRQFGSDWGVWVSPWHRNTVPCEDKGLWPASQAQIGGGHPAWSFKTSLYLSYVSGARVLTLQETEPIFSRAEPGNPEAGYKLAAWGTELKSFWDYVRNHPQRMDPIISLALLVDKDNGWQPGKVHGNWIDKQSIWSKIPTDRADAMLAGYLDVLIPGYGRTEPGWWDKNEMYPGYFCGTPIGAFDIVSSDISADKLSAYPSVMVMADVNMTQDLLDTLRAYVAGGGNLFVNVNQMRYGEDFVQDEEFLGATIGGRMIYSSWAGGYITGRRVVAAHRIVPVISMPGVKDEEYMEPWYAHQDVQPGTAEIVATDMNGLPVLLRNQFGDGHVYLSTPEYTLQGWEDQDRILNYFADLIRGLTLSGPINVTAPNSDTAQEGISWLASHRKVDEVVVLLANHDGSEKQVDVHWRNPCNGWAIEAGNGSILTTRQVNGDTIFTISIPGEDVALLSIDSSEPPSTPQVEDDGPFTTSTTTLSGSWSAEASGRPITEYWYAIGTTPGGTGIFPWTNAGLDTSVTQDGLSLSVGTRYFLSVRARSNNGPWSPVGTSKGISVVDAIGGPGDIKANPNGTTAGVSGVVTTNANTLSRTLFVQSPDRSGAIRVWPVDESPTPGIDSTVDVVGTLSERFGERLLSNLLTTVTGTADEPTIPLAMANRSIGGEPLNTYTPSISNGEGLYNLAMLVRTFGQVGSVNTSVKTFVIDDGSMIPSDAGEGLTVSYSLATGSISPPSVGQYVVVTGISSIRGVDGKRYPILRLRSQDDLLIVH